MSEKLFKFLLSEITLVRVHCRNDVCGGVIEIPIEKLGTVFRNCSCPLCHRQFDQGNWHGDNLLMIFAEAVKRLNGIKDKVGLEFVLPDTSDK